MSPDPQFLCLLPQIREALAGLEHGIEARKGLLVLVGEVGTGKTTLLRRALAYFDPNRVKTSFVFNPRLDLLDLLEFILNDFGIVPASRTKSGMLLQLNRWLIERYRKNEICVVVIDEAQDLSSDLLEEIRLLTNLETSNDKLLQIVLSGQPELETKLREPGLRQVRQRIAVWCRTSTLSLEETGPYIALRLRTAGGDPALFSASAMPVIYKASQGIPRIVNLICEHALIHAFAERQHTVGPEIVLAVAGDLRLEDLRLEPEFANQQHGPGTHPQAHDEGSNRT